MTPTEPAATRILLMTAPDAETAEDIVGALVDERLIACGNIVPGLTSIYRWQGEVERDAEVLVIMKTTTAALERTLDRAAALHPYDVPEVLSLPLTEGHRPYLDWVAESVAITNPKD